MAVQTGPLQLKRGTTAEVAAYTPAVGEPVLDQQLNWLSIGDGSDTVGIRGSGSVNPAYRDWFSGAGTNRTARDIVTGGTGTVDSGTRAFQAAAFVFTGASVDFSGVQRPGTDNTVTDGQVGKRYSDNFSVRYRPGAGAVIWTSGTGSPETVVTAPVGSMYTRTDGGANTTLYIKETGAAATGWVAK